MSVLDEINERLEQVTRECYQSITNIDIINASLDAVMKYIEDYPAVHGYWYISHQVREHYNTISQEFSGQEFVIHQQLLIARFIEKSIKRLNEENYPEFVMKSMLNSYNATLKNILKNHFSKEFFKIDNDKYQKLLSVCAMSTLLINPFLVDKDRISYRFLTTHTLLQFLKGVYTILFKLKGLSPVYKFHNNILDYNAMRYFNETGVRNMFKSVAAMMVINKRVKGVFATSWFWDPRVKEISPELSYLHNIINEIGGQVFKHTTSEKTVKNALFLNKTRKELYDKGLYKPYNYVLIITRNELISWAKNPES